MSEIELTETFRKLYAKLPQNIQTKAKKKLRLLAKNTRYPSLQSKPIEGAPGTFEARVDRDDHLTYERLIGDVLRIRAIGKHDEALKNP